jgi:antitoxin (DNA-binding transcriptional repressor) of toxin-antitoxin stability system
MTTFTLHLPREARPGDAAALDEAEFVKDAFSWGAFFFTFLWFFVHRLWLAGLGVMVLVFAVSGTLAVLDVHPLAATAAQLLLQLLIGLEANTLRRWTLTRRGRPIADVVTASDEDEAEARAFTRWLQGNPHARPVPARGPVPASTSIAVPMTRAPEPVIGLFPDTEYRR